MAISRVKTWVNGEVLTHTDLNAEFNNILNNALSLISPLTGELAAGGNDITGLDELALNDATANASAVGRLRRNGVNIHWHDRTVSSPLQTIVAGAIGGCGLSNSAGDPTNDIDIASGVAVDISSGGTMRLGSAITKQLDAAWAVGTNAGGLDTGAIANTTYHVWLIARVDTGVVDVLFSTSASSPTMPANYTLKRRIGSILREGGAIVLFSQFGNYFYRTTPHSGAATNPGTNAVTLTLSTPVGINNVALGAFQVSQTTAQQVVAYVVPTFVTDTAPTVGNALTTVITGPPATASEAATMIQIMTDTSAQIRYRLSFSDASTAIRFCISGWIDFRGSTPS